MTSGDRILINHLLDELTKTAYEEYGAMEETTLLHYMRKDLLHFTHLDSHYVYLLKDLLTHRYTLLEMIDICKRSLRSTPR